MPEIVLLIDKSESMISSAIYASIIGSILASLKSIKTHLIFFDTSITDVTGLYKDPVVKLALVAERLVVVALVNVAFPVIRLLVLVFTEVWLVVDELVEKKLVEVEFVIVPLVVLIDGRDRLVIERLVIVAEVKVALVPVKLVVLVLVVTKLVEFKFVVVALVMVADVEIMLVKKLVVAVSIDANRLVDVD